MSKSRLQERFIQEVAASFLATRERMIRQMAEEPESAAKILEHELRGLYHGLFVVFDGGSSLADEGLISIVDDSGEHFDRFLHEQCLRYWPSRDG